MSPDPVHHVEVCVRNLDDAFYRFSLYGFKMYAKRIIPNVCRQYVLKLADIYFVLTERSPKYEHSAYIKENEMPVFFCCAGARHDIDSVFNVCLHVEHVDELSNRITRESSDSSIVYPPTSIHDEYGDVRICVVKSVVGNVLHCVINSTNYKEFLPGFNSCADYEPCSESKIARIDHVTLATHSGQSSYVLGFYEKCFGMQPFSINNHDNENEGLILSGGIGLRLRAMEFYRCAEKCIAFYGDTSNKRKGNRNRKRDPKGLMLVIVESLPGQTNCNVESFLRAHNGPGIEHIAFFSASIVHDVRLLSERKIGFRRPPTAYYDEIEKNESVKNLENLEDLKKLGILIDLESESESPEKKRFILQIFAHPLLSEKTFFIEIINRVNEARGLGANNIIALVKSIRQDDKRLQESRPEEVLSRRIC